MTFKSRKFKFQIALDSMKVAKKFKLPDVEQQSGLDFDDIKSLLTSQSKDVFDKTVKLYSLCQEM
jgi:hypothetical protein